MARIDSAIEYWNPNVHYQPVILRAVPVNCAQALEVGCGDGMLACRLAGRCAEVTAIDRDARYRRHLLWRYSLLWAKP